MSLLFSWVRTRRRMFMSRPQRFPMDHSLFLKTDLLARLTTVRASKVTIDKRHTCRIYCLPASETGASCNGSDFGDVTYPFSSSVWKTQLTGTPLSVPWCLNLLMPKNAACVCDIFVSQDLKFIYFLRAWLRDQRHHRSDLASPSNDLVASDIPHTRHNLIYCTFIRYRTAI